MSGYTVLANRYRPRAFDEVVGQQDTARVLQTALAQGRVAHAYLLSGPRGVGKTSMARILARAVACARPDGATPCGACGPCRALGSGADALDVVEIDGASHNKVENVRELIENVRFRPVEARRRVYVIDEVHMLSTSAFNALLKTLEEPPEHALFILATTEPLKVPETIRSRCQGFEFRRLSGTEIAQRLAAVCEAEGVPADEALLLRVARHAKGGMRDALSLLDQLITYGDGHPDVEDFERLTGRLSPEHVHALLDAVLDEDGGRALTLAGEAFERGVRAGDLLDQLAQTLQGVLVVASGAEPADRTEEERAGLAALGERADPDRLLAMLDVLVEAGWRLRQRHDALLVVEMAILTLARLRWLEPVADAIAALGEGGAPAPRPRASASLFPDPPPAPRAGSRGADAPARGGAPPAPRPERGTAAGRDGPGGARAAAASATEPAPTREAFLGRLGRSLRLQLASAPVRWEDPILRVGPVDAVGFDPDATRERLTRAARETYGTQARVEVVAADDAAAPRPRATEPAPPFSSSQAPEPDRRARPAPRGDGADADDPVSRALREWPGSEEVDI